MGSIYGRVLSRAGRAGQSRPSPTGLRAHGLASTDREVVLVEAKSTDAFPHGKRAEQIAKLMHLAGALRADRIVLATTQPQWKQSDVDHLGREAGRVSPFPLQTKVLAALGARASAQDKTQSP